MYSLEGVGSGSQGIDDCMEVTGSGYRSCGGARGWPRSGTQVNLGETSGFYIVQM